MLLDLERLVQRLFEQLTDNLEIPASARSLEAKTTELVKAAAGRLILLTLDDLWDTRHLAPFNCIDSKTGSKLLITTRIKGVLGNGTEIELELLGLKESVDLISAVAGLGADSVPPCCLEIAALCGRLPVGIACLLSDPIY